jgi:hypothetical protein
MMIQQAAPRKIGRPLGCGLRLQTCLGRFGQGAEAKPLASGGLQGAALYAKRQARGSSCWQS